jgi:hypothetical protein
MNTKETEKNSSPLVELFPLDWQVATAYIMSASVQALLHALELGMVPEETTVIAEAISVAEELNTVCLADDAGKVDVSQLMKLIQAPVLLAGKLQKAFNQEFQGFGNNHLLVTYGLLAHAKTCLEHEAPELVPAWENAVNHFTVEYMGKTAIPELKRIDWSDDKK